MESLTKYQLQFYHLLQLFFDDDVVPYEVSRFIGIIPGQNTLRGHTDYVFDCCISSDDTFIVSASEDKTLKLWNTETGEEIRTLRGHNGSVYQCCISNDDTFVVLAKIGTKFLETFCQVGIYFQ